MGVGITGIARSIGCRFAPCRRHALAEPAHDRARLTAFSGQSKTRTGHETSIAGQRGRLAGYSRETKSCFVLYFLAAKGHVTKSHRRNEKTGRRLQNTAFY